MDVLSVSAHAIKYDFFFNINASRKSLLYLHTSPMKWYMPLPSKMFSTEQYRTKANT